MKTICSIMRFSALLFCMVISHIPFAFAQIHVVAAENFYGNVAKELGGDWVNVTSVLQNPDQDPHLFTANPSVAKAVATADIVVYNGAHYDDWMKHLLSVPSKKKRIVLVVADLIDMKEIDNPHIWYIPSTMPDYARVLVSYLAKLDPAHKEDYMQQLKRFMVEQSAFEAAIQQLRQRVQKLPVTATEPVFNGMVEALGLHTRNLAFQWSIANESSPSPGMVKAMLDDLYMHKVRVLFYNTQVTSSLVQQIKAVAEKNHIPLVGVSEMQPQGVSYHQWMQQQLQSVARVLI